MTDDIAAAAPKKQELSELLRGYGQGVIDGHRCAQQQIEELTEGAITLTEPAAVRDWRARLKRAGYKPGGGGHD